MAARRKEATMGLADGIRKHGFRKWYERELIASHAHLVLTFLCAIGLFAAFEVYSRDSPLGDQLTNVFAVLICGIIGWWALRRYLYLLMHAEAVANQAVCAECNAYARFGLVANDAFHGSVQVRCKRCGHEWPIEHTGD
jgi:hypothetical protein